MLAAIRYLSPRLSFSFANHLIDRIHSYQIQEQAPDLDLDHEYRTLAQQIKTLVFLRLQRERDEFSLLVERFDGVADLLSSTIVQELVSAPSGVQPHPGWLRAKVEEAVWRCESLLLWE